MNKLGVNANENDGHCEQITDDSNANKEKYNVIPQWRESLAKECFEECSTSLASLSFNFGEKCLNFI